VAKYKTTAQLLALGFLIAPPKGVSFIDSEAIGLGLLWAAALLTLYTGYDYMRAGMKHVMDE
jgi:phosphatidylglycerophosphate synthase